MEDQYQERYIRHQEKKKRQLMFSEGTRPHSVPHDIFSLLEFRRSQRVFTSEPIDESKMKKIFKAATMAPSSCNRHGIRIRYVSGRANKELLSGILVGGVGWIHRADAILLLLADPAAYKSPNEKDFMHYCDAGFMAMSMWLAADALGIGAAYINPNITHKDIFQEKFGHGLIFCGALVLGNYDRRAIQADRPSIEEILILPC